MRAAHGEVQKFFHDVVMSYNGIDCLKWPYATNDNGYAVITIEGKTRRVSRLVCEHADGPPPTPKHQAAHSCGNGHLACVTKRHLSWKTKSENEADKIDHGTVARGSRCGRSKLIEADVVAIRSLHGFCSKAEIAAMFSVTKQAIGDIHRGRTWAWHKPTEANQ